ncbi:MAG: DUF1905 domain-containing protein [Pseudomonas sp.]|nr:DUF1905 domain-containing protein [Pseudomonas sp.]
MSQEHTKSRFQALLQRPVEPGDGQPWAFIVLPKSASDKLPRRGRTTVDASLNGHSFQATLEPDGQLSHWLRLDGTLLDTAGATIGATVEFEITAVEQEPEPDIPADLQQALNAAPDALAVWHDTTTIARLDWIHWITTAKQSKTRAKRINDACSKLAQGKRRVCCFDPSGFYSKALSAPKAVG